jgi:DNA-binding response OmpR family regulator
MSLYLRKVPDLAFELAGADSEAAAVEEFRRQPRDLVLLDYQLAQGNGLNCLRSIRQLDARVPIIAISGAATSSVAAELLQSGADDFISKAHLSVKGLERSIRLALSRADAYRRRQAVAQVNQSEPVVAGLRQLCQRVLEQWRSLHGDQLTTLAQAIHRAGLSDRQVRQAFQIVHQDLAQESALTMAELKLLLQPILPVLQLRQHALAERNSL